MACKFIQKFKLRPHEHQFVKDEVSLLYECAGHEHIVRILDSFEDPGYYYVVLEFVSGGNWTGPPPQPSHHAFRPADTLSSVGAPSENAFGGAPAAEDWAVHLKLMLADLRTLDTTRA